MSIAGLAELLDFHVPARRRHIRLSASRCWGCRDEAVPVCLAARWTRSPVRDVTSEWSGLTQGLSRLTREVRRPPEGRAELTREVGRSRAGFNRPTLGVVALRVLGDRLTRGLGGFRAHGNDRRRLDGGA